MDWFASPWPWYVAGPLVGLTVPLLLLLVERPFGISSSFRHLASACWPSTRLEYLRANDWRRETWSLVFVAGVVLGAWIAAHALSTAPVALLPDGSGDAAGLGRLLAGGVLVGFGTRWADGCTSGHSIMGLSNLSPVSLAATVSFFAGGLLMVHVLAPLWS